MKTQPKGPQAARIRQRKYELIRRFQIPDDLLPGSLSIRYSRCNTPNCHCAEGKGHPLWSLTFMVDGMRQLVFHTSVGAQWSIGIDLLGIGVFAALMMGLGAVLARKALLRT